MSKSLLFCVLLVASLSGTAWACSCRQDLTLEQRYQYADHILIARISGCAPDRLSDDGGCSRHGWTFETVENLKGSDARVEMTPSDLASNGVSTCDISLNVGETYLLFLRGGRSDRCSTASLSGAGGARKLSDVEILRAYRDGKLTRIIDPWYFADTGWACGIAHLLDGGIQARFNYAYARPPESIPQKITGAFPKPTPTLTLQLLGQFEWAGPTRLEVNGESVSFTRKTIPLPDKRTFSLDLVQGDAVLALLDRMVQPAELVVSGSRSSVGRAAEPFRATTNTARAADAAARFKACVEAHPAQ